MRCSGAAIADLLHDRLLARARTEPPPNRKRQRCRPLASSINPKTQPQPERFTDGTASAQAACRAAVRRAAELARLARLYDDLGLVDASLRAAAVAEGIRAMLA